MQKDASYAADGVRDAAVSSPPRSQDQQVLSTPQKQPNGSGLTSLYSIFSPETSPSNSVPLSPSGCSCDGDNNNNAIATENRLYLAGLTLEFQQLVNRYGICLNRLQEITNEVEALREENAKLRLTNKDLTMRLNLLTQASLQNLYVPSALPSLSIIDDFRRLYVGDNVRNSGISGEISDSSPTSVIGSNQFEMSTDRVSLPKSISIRSSGYLKMNHAAGSSGGSTRTNRLRVASPVLSGTQRVFVPGEKKEEEALEFEVYNQGMFKTELCNKWQQTGTCPYGENCQFAHGISELRPVIRHPRYKTEVCRMVLAGDTCPYGHRCHFRHALTDHEKFMGPI
ncbi:PREDICTED: zinc finger CCCH domain-containing protein 14-like [Nelumbo nucifera]|uniref:Zinc finger CCCH domain-containing protein 14-like n=1 Tax=Nelumbo nucifera TaxID=4432 RepID=A0A1U7ZJG0_NELNU|nr:PREDICTED: zinc finger CCCH domain-containing protein 14-like [Nelumbo nucifera]